MDRKMASIQQVLEIRPIEGADLIEVAKINGWNVVVKKGEFFVGELVVYCEIDSFIPSAVAPFLTKVGHFPKEYNGVQGERLKTIKLRGQLSQGLILPIDILSVEVNYSVGDDVSEYLGIQKWEPPEDAGTVRNAKGSFPYFIRKTDQERVQSLTNEIVGRAGESFEVTVKIDGSSLTCFYNNGEVGVCSRNIELKEDEGNAFWSIVRKEQILEKLEGLGRNLAVQGELLAPNIQGNYEKVNAPQFHCFSIFDIDQQEYLLPQERRALCEHLNIPHVKVLDKDFVLCQSTDEILGMADGEGMNLGVRREGIVLKSNSTQFSFKAISNAYLLKRG